jgi:hypothetical protein
VRHGVSQRRRAWAAALLCIHSTRPAWHCALRRSNAACDDRRRHVATGRGEV